METAPQFFRQGPSLLARLGFFVLLSLLLMAADSRFKYLPEIRQAFSIVIYPIQKLANVPAQIYNTASELFVSQHVTDENEYLKQRYLADRGQLQQLQALEAENIQLGQITRNSPWLSEVTLITDRDHSVPVQVVRNGLRSVVSGTGKDGTLELRYVAVNTDIEEGDMLVTSGIDGVYPPGLPVAMVSKIERNPTYIFARVTCTPAAGVGRHRQLLILSAMTPVTENPADTFEIKPKSEGKKREKIGIR